MGEFHEAAGEVEPGSGITGFGQHAPESPSSSNPSLMHLHELITLKLPSSKRFILFKSELIHSHLYLSCNT